MTTTAPDTGVWRQMSALFHMEMLLLRRNLTTAVLVVVLPLALGVIRLGLDPLRAGEARVGAERIASAIGMIAAIFVHHHLVTVYAARRQELVLKRLRAGLPTDGTIIAGAAAAITAVFVAQTIALAAYAVLGLRLPVPANPVVILLAVLLAAGLMTTTSAVVSAVTRSSEAAMMTTFPTVALFLATPGVMLSYGVFPDPVERAAWFSPLGPLGEVIRIGWIGPDNGAGFVESAIDTLPGLAVMAAWLALTALAVRKLFRWEPRHK
jgi:ABC-2 type transport system permease protein